MNEWLYQRDSVGGIINILDVNVQKLPVFKIINDDLEETTIKIFDKLDVATDPSNIEDCHWLKSNVPKKVIIKFARRKDANLIWKNKNRLKGMNLCSIGINNPVFIDD